MGTPGQSAHAIDVAFCDAAFHIEDIINLIDIVVTDDEIEVSAFQQIRQAIVPAKNDKTDLTSIEFGDDAGNAKFRRNVSWVVLRWANSPAERSNTATAP